MQQTTGEETPLRVLALSPTSLVSGAERVLIDYATFGLTRGEQWSLACPPGPLAHLAKQAGIAWIETPELRLTGGSKARSLFSLAGRNLQMARIVRRFADRFDVILANSVMSLPALVPARVTTPVCWLVHDVITRRDLRLVARIGGHAVTLAVAVSDAAMESPAALGIKSTVVRNGVKWPVPVAKPVGDPPIVGISAVLTEWKGHRVFLKALSQIEQPFRAEILGGTFPGDLSYEAELRETVGNLGLDDRVDFLGHSDSPLDVMGRWSIAVSASVEPEAGPLSVLEAMSLAIPVVVSDHGGAPEVSSGAGLAVVPGDPGALAGAISALLSDPPHGVALGQVGRQKVADSFSLTHSRANFAAVLAGLADT
ncbi:MAG: glycosyltransferase family 4 protein [Acidimicrobiales bacterium]